MTNEDLQLPAGFATPSYTGSKYETVKLKKEDDRLELRVLPSMKSLIKKGDFGAYWKTHFGWMGRNQQDSSKLAWHPFLCVEEKRNGMTTNACPACQYRLTYEKKYAAAKADMEKQVTDLTNKGKSKGIPEVAINKEVAKLKEKLMGEMRPIAEWLQSHGCDGKMRIPCINRQGQFVLFSAPYGLVKKLREAMKEVSGRCYPGTEIQISPTGRKGVWFEFVRTGKANATSDSVHPVRVSRSDGSEILDFHVITNEQLTAAQDAIPDLVELMEQNRIRLDQIEALVELDKSGGGSSDPDEVDRILEIGKSEQEPDWAAEEPVSTPVPVVTAAVEPVVVKATEVVKAAAETPVVVEQKQAVVETPTTLNGAEATEEQWASMWTK